MIGIQVRELTAAPLPGSSSLSWLGSLPLAKLGSRPIAPMLLAGLLLAGGCSTPAASADPRTGSDRRAVLVMPTAATRAELTSAVSEALNGAPVRLDHDALTARSEISISRVPRRDSAGRPLLGRTSEKPERFQLIEQAGRCILVQERTGRRWRLRSATCAPAPDK